IDRPQTKELVSGTADRPKPGTTSLRTAPTRDVNVTIEEVANRANILKDFPRVEENAGAPGPDGRTVEDVRKELEHTLRRLQRMLVEGTYQPGSIRRGWISNTRRGPRAT